MTNPSELGRLERVINIRNVWDKEAQDFTPWLAQDENIALLGETIGLELEVESTEKGVGPYRADILCKDTSSSQYVLIENQLEATDHLHLGQLLTYAAGLDAVTIIWVARHFNPEHRAAIDWLNQITDQTFNFFALEIELWRIGNSPLAPKFNVVSQPNDWIVAVKEDAVRAGSFSVTQQLHLDYWTQLRDYMEAKNSSVKVGKPSTDHWKDFSVGRVGFKLIAVNSMKMKGGFSYVALVLTGPDAKAHYHLLEEKHQAVKQAFGSDVDWREMPERKESHIVIRRSSSEPANRDKWTDLNEWFAETLEKMDGFFKPIVKSLDASEYIPSLSEEPV